MKFNQAFLLLLLLFTACSKNSITPDDKTQYTQKSPVIISTDVKSLKYEVIYKDGDFEIREVLIGDKDLQFFSSFSGRVQEKVENLNPPKFVQGGDWCDKLQAIGWCSQIIEFEKSNDEDVYDFQCDSWSFIRNCKLYKNGQLIWNGHMNGGLDFPVESIKRIGDEIVISYVDSNYGEDTDQFWRKNIIIITKGNKIERFENVHTPNEIRDNFIYFRQKNNEEALVLDGNELPETYDYVMSWPCCGGGYSIQVNSDGQIIDFFASKGNDWYHVQAGYFDSALK